MKSTICVNRIARLEAAIEANKQDRLKNNIRISGLPSTSEMQPTEIASKIFSSLKLNINNSEFHAYATRGKAFIIVVFHTFLKKMMVISAMRKKKSLLCEEIFPGQVSNGKVFINDHLSDFNAHLLNIAWRAKREGKLFFVSSNGGKIRVKKHEGENETIFIFSEDQLLSIIDESPDISSSQNINTSNTTSASTSATQDAPNNTDQRHQQQQRTHNPPVQFKNTNKRRLNHNNSNSSNDANDTAVNTKHNSKRNKQGNQSNKQAQLKQQPHQTTNQRNKTNLRNKDLPK